MAEQLSKKDEIIADLEAKGFRIFRIDGCETFVVIDENIVALYGGDGDQITSSNVDYYYDEGKGYGLKTEEDVAKKYHLNFCEDHKEN